VEAEVEAAVEAGRSIFQPLATRPALLFSFRKVCRGVSDDGEGSTLNCRAAQFATTCAIV
jgi:hypothetical protein